jgi:hypothetical protein
MIKTHEGDYRHTGADLALDARAEAIASAQMTINRKDDVYFSRPDESKPLSVFSLCFIYLSVKEEPMFRRNVLIVLSLVCLSALLSVTLTTMAQEGDKIQIAI